MKKLLTIQKKNINILVISYIITSHRSPVQSRKSRSSRHQSESSDEEEKVAQKKKNSKKDRSPSPERARDSVSNNPRLCNYM